jgi:diaminohydroxyphosphoribosylaminopyrimidine deaminase/5-amino-6-(5-phosphoribosylamino)uracil reductase
MAPCLMGHEAKPMFFLPGLVEMSDKMPFQYQSVQTVGDDLHLVLKPVSDAITLATSF